MRRLFIIFLALAMLAISCADNPADPEPAGVTAEASSPADAYTNSPVNFSASCSSSDGIESATLQFSSPDSDGSFTRTESVTGNNFSETFSHTFSSEGEASLQISCTSAQGITNTAQTSTTIIQFRTGLSLELRNATTGELQEGYVLAGEDSLYTETGILDVELTDPSINSILSGLSTASSNGFGNFASFLRESAVVSGQNNSLELYHLDFAFRDVTSGVILGHLSTTGYDRDGDMDLERFLLHIDENILYEGELKRWKDPIQKIVFAAAVNRTNIGSINSFDHPDLLFDTYKEQWEQIMQPHLPYEIPFEREEMLVYSTRDDFRDIILITPDSTLVNRGPLAMVFNERDTSGRITGSSITMRDVLPDKETNRPNYDLFLKGLFLHEIYSSLVNSGRSVVHTRSDESILPNPVILRDEISLVDSKILKEIVYNSHFGEDTSLYLILPPGYPTQY